MINIMYLESWYQYSIHIYIYTYIHIHNIIYIYREREKEREREIQIPALPEAMPTSQGPVDGPRPHSGDGGPRHAQNTQYINKHWTSSWSLACYSR